MASFLVERIVSLLDVEDLDCKPLGVALPGSFSSTAVHSITASIIHMTQEYRLSYPRIFPGSRSCCSPLSLKWPVSGRSGSSVVPCLHPGPSRKGGASAWLDVAEFDPGQYFPDTEVH